MTAYARRRSSRVCRGVRRKRQRWRWQWSPMSWPAAAISEASCGQRSTCSPTRKKAACAAASSSRSSTAGVACGWGAVVEAEQDLVAGVEAVAHAEGGAERPANGGRRGEPVGADGDSRDPREQECSRAAPGLRVARAYLRGSHRLDAYTSPNETGASRCRARRARSCSSSLASLCGVEASVSTMMSPRRKVRAAPRLWGPMRTEPTIAVAPMLRPSRYWLAVKPEAG